MRKCTFYIYDLSTVVTIDSSCLTASGIKWSAYKCSLMTVKVTPKHTGETQ
jgi:hypothetical protein